MPEPTTPSARTLIKRLSEVMKEVSKIPKNGKNTFHNYKYVMESDLVEAVRERLADRKVFITSSTKAIEIVELAKANKLGVLVPSKIGVLRVDYTFHDGESGETLTMESIGEIDQDGGKGLYKALTGAMKYFLMKNFLVATGDDPEQHDGPKVAPPAKAPEPPAPAPKKAPASTKQQQERILSLAKDLQMDVQKDICGPAKVVWPMTGQQADAVIKRLEQKRTTLAKELDAEVATAERKGMATA